RKLFLASRNASILSSRWQNSDLWSALRPRNIVALCQKWCGFGTVWSRRDWFAKSVASNAPVEQPFRHNNAPFATNCGGYAGFSLAATRPDSTETVGTRTPAVPAMPLRAKLRLPDLRAIRSPETHRSFPTTVEAPARQFTSSALRSNLIDGDFRR